mmetsp:Transcript_24811/g.57640  ORF Transcript_24811/g.57640 Transcript_24811/m.57640 type:complete len:291 (+) Transcript_24811:62-934(+)
MPDTCCCMETAVGLAAAVLAIYRGDKANPNATSSTSAPAAEASSSGSSRAPEPTAPTRPLEEVCESLKQQLPSSPRVCILGGTHFQDPDSELIVKSLAKHFARNLASSVVVLTGGMSGVQETFARSMGVEMRRWGSARSRELQAESPGSPSQCQTNVLNLLPEGQSSSYGVGRDLEAGTSVEERKRVFATLGHIYVTIEGGPGVAEEASMAFNRGAVVLPIASTGGASSGMFDFPAGALAQPSFATQEQWDTLMNKGDADDVALAVVQIIWTLISKGGRVATEVGVGLND